MRFYLGTHQPAWLAQLDVPLSVSRRRLAQRRTLPRARAPWALDSGGFTELRLSGGWTLRPVAYVCEVRRYADEIGQMDWAAPMDWMFTRPSDTCQKPSPLAPRHAAPTDMRFFPIVCSWERAGEAFQDQGTF